MRVAYSYLPEQFADPDPILEDLRALVASGDFTLGKALGKFERSFADALGAKHAIGVGSGTDAIFLSGVGGGLPVLLTIVLLALVSQILLLTSPLTKALSG